MCYHCIDLILWCSNSNFRDILQKCTLSYNGKNRGEEGGKKGKIKVCSASNMGAVFYSWLLAQISAANQEQCPRFPWRRQGCRKEELSWLLYLLIYAQILWVSIIKASLGPVAHLKTNIWMLPTEQWRKLAWAETDKANRKPPLLIHFWAAGDLVIVEGLMKDTVRTRLLSWECIGSKSVPATTGLHRGRNMSPTPGLILPTDLSKMPGCVLWKGCSQTWCLYP